MDKYSYFATRETDGGIVGTIPLFVPGADERVFEKVASGGLLPEVVQYIAGLRPRQDARYFLTNAMGASEFYGQNVNHDLFPEASLNHRPDDWSGNPLVDSIAAAQWPYGFPTFYTAHVFCFPGDTPVVMGDRARVPIGSVVAGQSVQTAYGPRRVLRKYAREYCGEVVRVALKGNYTPLTGTPNHEVWVYRREQLHCSHGYNRLSHSGHRCKQWQRPVGGPSWVALDDLRVGDYCVVVPPEAGGMSVDPRFAELVGWVASEGYLTKAGGFQFTFSVRNTADIEAVAFCLEYHGLHVTRTPVPKTKMLMLSASGRELWQRVCRYTYGIKQHKRVFSEVLQWDRNGLLRFLGAFIDGDGHVPKTGKNAGQLRIRSSSPALLRDLQDVMHALGVPATVQWDCKPYMMRSPVNGKHYLANGSGTTTVSSGWASQVTLYSRKHFIAPLGADHTTDMLDGHFLVRVQSKDREKFSGTVFNLEVEEHHHYFANEVMVHNCHHRNKDPKRAIGGIELAAWNPHMKRVELVSRVDREACLQFGGEGFWTRLNSDEYPDTSMGTRVPWDRCTTCTDVAAYRAALDTYDPTRHRHPGMAVLEVHKRLRAKRGRGLPGIAENRSEYCECMRKTPGVILPDGRRVGVYNDYPRFFDDSLVFIGADRTAKVMMHIKRTFGPTGTKPTKVGGDGLIQLAMQTAAASEHDGSLWQELNRPAVGEKQASVLRKAAKVKRGEILKNVLPSQFANKAVPVLTHREQDLPREFLELLARRPREDGLSAVTSMGIILRPREFQTMELLRDHPMLERILRETHQTFPAVDGEPQACRFADAPPMDLLRMLLPHVMDRSCLSPPIERRILIIQMRRPTEHPDAKTLAYSEDEKAPSSHTLSRLHKLGTAYRDYRAHVMNTLPILPLVIAGNEKLASVLGFGGEDVEHLYTPLSVAYASQAFWDEVGRRPC